MFHRRSFAHPRFSVATTLPSASATASLLWSRRSFYNNANSQLQDQQDNENIADDQQPEDEFQDSRFDNTTGRAAAMLQQTTEQRESFLRHARRRRKLENTTSKMLYEFHFLKKICQKRPTTRQWLIRDDVIDFSPGIIEMSPSMQAAYMRVVHSKEKGVLRQSIRDIVPVILYRQTEKQQPLLPRDGANQQALIPASEPGTLNAKKREMFERKDSISAFQDERLVDKRAQNQLRWKIRLRLIKFQKQLAVQNASASRSILYSESDAIGYFVFRAAPMYAALHRVFFELGKFVPHFVPKTMLDFGSGTGTAILVAKEVFDTDGLAMPVDRQARRNMNSNHASVQWGLKELKNDLGKVSKTNAARRRARFIAVSSLIANGEISLSDIPADLRKEIVSAARVAALRAKERERTETLGRLKKFVATAVNWDDDAEIEKELKRVDSAAAAPRRMMTRRQQTREQEGFSEAAGGDESQQESTEDFQTDPTREAEAQDVDTNIEDLLSGVAGSDASSTTKSRFASSANAQGEVEEDDNGDASSLEQERRGGDNNKKKTWWEQYVDDEFSSKQDAAKRMLRPLQHIVAVEPSPGMVETCMSVLQDDVPNISYERYLSPDDATQHDLVTCAYTLSEIASPEERARTVRDLWRRTRGVLVLMEYANLPNFNLIMEARDTILSEKGVGLWDWQPTIVGPCPHEKRCPIRFSGLGVKRKSMRVCKTEVSYRPTFVEQWVHAFSRDDIRRKRTSEPCVYMIFARNEIIPERAEARLEEQRREEAAAAKKRDRAQKDLFKEALRTKETMFEGLSDEALERPAVNGAGPDAENEFDDGDDRKIPSTSKSLLAHPASVPESAVAAADIMSAVSENMPPSSLLSNGPVMPGSVKYETTTNGFINRVAFPNIFPVATHRYNRAPFVGAAHQLQRVISPTEMMVVRRDVAETRKKYQKLLHKYWRVVLTLPKCSGKVLAHFCTSDGDLVRGRIYRRFYGRGIRKQTNSASASTFKRWQYMGGWRYLRRARLLSAFPTDVPIYSIRKLPQIDFPNTMMHHTSSVVEQTAMQHNAPLDSASPDIVGGDAFDGGDAFSGGRAKAAFSNAENDEAAVLKRMTSSTLPPKAGDDNNNNTNNNNNNNASSSFNEGHQQDDESPNQFYQNMADDRTDQIFKMMNRGAVTSAQIDSRSPISGMEWVNAVRGAKKRMRQQQKQQQSRDNKKRRH